VTPFQPTLAAQPHPPDDWGHDAPPTSSRPLNLAVAAASALGAIFSAVTPSTSWQFLDRQVHSRFIAPFVPGAGKELGESGCRTVMLSPYSSFFP